MSHHSLGITIGDEASEVLALLTKYADVSRAEDTWPLEGRIMQIAKSCELCNETAARDVIVTAYNDLHRFVSIRCNRTRDAESPFSIPNWYPVGHKFRRSYAVRVATEARELDGFDAARIRILARVSFHFNLAAIDAVLSDKSPVRHPITAPNEIKFQRENAA